MRIMITLLSYDHGILRQVLDVVSDMAAEGSFDQHRDIMPEVSSFFLDFMDRYHHGREEKFVFPAAADSPERIKAMIPELIDEHRTARSFALAAPVYDAYGTTEIWDIDRRLVAIATQRARLRPIVAGEAIGPAASR